MKNFISLSQLKIEVKKAGITSQIEYKKNRKPNWPSCPDKHYSEWISWNDLFGKEKIEYISLSQLKIEVEKAGITSVDQYCKNRKPNWPSCPDQYYKEEWINWPNLFGREKIEYISLKQLKIEVKKAGITSFSQYCKHKKPNWPSSPDQYYKKEWINWFNFFGKKKIEYISLSRLKIEVKKAGITSQKEYRIHRKPNWPSRPDQYYKKEWISWGDLFGKEKIEYISLRQLKIEVKKAGINSENEYKKHRKPNWPSCPDQYYKEEWINWPNLFGREKIEISLSQLKIEVKKAGITSQKEYRIYRKPNWPSAPNQHYKEEWISWSDLFGRATKKKIEYISSLSQLKIEVKKAGINSQIEYFKHRRPNWPRRPDQYYKKEWINWFNFFGKKKIEYISLSRLKIEVKKAGITSQKEYRIHRKPNWPSRPDQYYKKEWISWPNFFGKILDLKKYVIRKLSA